MKMKPLYKVTIERCIDGLSYDAEIAKLGHYAITPGRWLKNQQTARLWVKWQISMEVWRSLRFWRHQRPYKY